MTPPPSTPTTTTTSQVATVAEPSRLDALRWRLDRILRRTSLPLLRISLGVVFIWFGALKLADATPVKELVADTVPWVDPELSVRVLGGFEIVVGAALMSGFMLGWVCAAMIAHLGGTFLTVVMQPEALFQHGNPLMLTMEGEFVTKNLVLITAALVIAAWARRRPAIAG
jgi:uncharacterized membrane protein YkgB